MALASQNARKPTTSRVYTSRRGKSWRQRRQSQLRRVTGLMVLVFLTIGSGWWWFNREPSPAAAGDRDIAQTTPAAANAVLPNTASTPASQFNLTNRPAEKPRTPARASASTSPVTLTMGEPARTSAAAAKNTLAPAKVEQAPRSSTSPAGAIASLIQDADNALIANQPLIARLLLSRALQDSRGSETQQQAIRARLTSINNELVFSPRVVEGDPITDRYVVKSGDTLAKITSKLQLKTDWRLLQRINRISDPRRIRVGQTIKVIRGPFVAVIHKSEFRLDLYALVGADGSAESSVYIRSFDVGLGQYGSTPIGSWVVRSNSKLINPPWRNPQTGKSFGADNPANPIGERWIGLAGTDDNTRPLQGYGLHGTISPDSIGGEFSMGCIRLGSDDINLLYEMLVEDASAVEIRP